MSVLTTIKTPEGEAVIRNVRPDDAAALARIYNQFVRQTTATFATEPVASSDMADRIDAYTGYVPFIVVEIDGAVQGYCYAHPWKQLDAYAPTLEVTVYLDAAARGRGVGERMVRLIIDQSRKMGFHSLIACITADNEASLALFAKLGFERVSYFREVGYKFEHWLDVVDMQLIL